MAKCDRCGRESSHLVLEDTKAGWLCLKCAGRPLVLSKETIYRKLQMPFWKLAGQKPTPEEAKTDKWLKKKGMDYYDLQKMRDIQEGAHYKKDLSNLRNKPQSVEYKKI